MKEIAIMKLLLHPNLVKLCEIIDDEQSKFLYLVMEYVDLGPIMQYNASTGTFTCKLTGGVLLESMASRLFAELLSGLSYLHLNHIAHRDLKPDNLLVNCKGQLKISDFGVSSHFAEEKIKMSVGLRQLARSKSRGAVNRTEGTWPFWSPEMCQESAAKYSAYMSDIWAASVCLWVFVFGKLPWYNVDVLHLFKLIRFENMTFLYPFVICNNY
jgi:[calcium/calmodulin-dependent protein kinase] kinase